MNKDLRDSRLGATAHRSDAGVSTTCIARSTASRCSPSPNARRTSSSAFPTDHPASTTFAARNTRPAGPVLIIASYVDDLILATGGQHVRAATRQQPAAQRPPHSARRSVEYRAVNPGPGGDAGITRRRAGGGRHTHRGWARRGQAARIPTWAASPTCRREPPTPRRRCGQDPSHNLVRASVSQRAAVTA